MFGSLTRRAARGPAPRRARGDDGAAMVEAAIVMPLLMLLVFGIIEWGLAFLSATSTNSAARSGARTASALTQNTSYAQQAVLAVEQNLKGALPFATPEELWIYRVPASVLTTPGPRGQTSFVCGANCIKYTWNGTCVLADLGLVACRGESPVALPPASTRWASTSRCATTSSPTSSVRASRSPNTR